MDAPSLEAVRRAAAELAPLVIRTPVQEWSGGELAACLGDQATVSLKLELLQHTGSFKVRGALSVLLNTPPEQLANGVTAVSAGNHAIAVAYAARMLDIHAKVVMFEGVSPLRRSLAESHGAEVLIARDVAAAFELAEQIARQEGRLFVHPFEGPFTTLGTATLGLEWIQQLDRPLDAVIVGIGGGGLMSGVARVFKLLCPGTEVIGVEPEGADTMHRSFAAGSPQSIPAVKSVADSLGSPMAMPYSFELCRRHVDRLVRVSDQEIIAAMGVLFRDRKLAVEPAAAAAVAALLWPLAKDLRDRHVGVLLCGSNIDVESFCRLVHRDRWSAEHR